MSGVNMSTRYFLLYILLPLSLGMICGSTIGSNGHFWEGLAVTIFGSFAIQYLVNRFFPEAKAKRRRK